MNKIALKAYGKVNLGLDVVRKREDGYHDLNMVMQTVSVYDCLEICKTAEPGIKLKTNHEDLDVNEDNLIYKAAKTLMDEFQIKEGVSIDLDKNLPISAGMAGGSSDCAATLKGINSLFELGLSDDALRERGMRLGADVPYCIMGGTVSAKGIGDILTPIGPSPQCHVLIVKPPVYMTTKSVYESLDLEQIKKHPDIQGIIDAINDQDLERMAGKLENVLEIVTFKRFPVVKQIKEHMKELGALGAIMSGSGPTVFGLFENETKAIEAYSKIITIGTAKDIFLTKFQNNIDN